MLRRYCVILIAVWGLLASHGSTAFAQNKIDEFSLERRKQLREAERYQMDVADKYYRERQYKIALGEYEKFVTLYEKSEGTPFAQLKWGICQIHLKKINTAISEGFQTVIDYWPESPEASIAAFYIGRCYKENGEVKKAKKAYLQTVSKYESSLAAVYSLNDLLDIADVEVDVDGKVAVWRKLSTKSNGRPAMPTASAYKRRSNWRRITSARATRPKGSRPWTRPTKTISGRITSGTSAARRSELSRPM